MGVSLNTRRSAIADEWEDKSMKTTSFVVVAFEADKADAVFHAMRGAITPLLNSGAITQVESVGYMGFMLGQLLADIGVQLDPNKPYEPMLYGYKVATEAQQKGKAKQ